MKHIEIGYAYPTSTIATRLNKGRGIWYVKIGDNIQKEQDRSSAIDAAIEMINQGYSLSPLQRHSWLVLQKIPLTESISDKQLLEKCRHKDFA